MPDDAAILEKVLTEADALIRRRLKKHGVEAPYLTIAATKDGQAVLRGNVGPGALQEIGMDLIEIGKQVDAEEKAKKGETTH